MSLVATEDRGAVRHLILNRPEKRNALNGELTRALREGNFGINVPPGEPQQLAETLSSLAANPDVLEQFASSGRAFVAQFEIERVLGRFVRELELLAE